MSVRAKKHLGQHFLKDKNIAEKIAGTLPKDSSNVLEIGPGMGVLTHFLNHSNHSVKVVEIDTESVDYLKANRIIEPENIIETDFLKAEITSFFNGEEFSIIGNFPYNISSQIVFKTLESRDKIPFFSGMFQKEVAERIAMKPGSKAYGILSVLTQAFYEVEYLFTVPPTVFSPPPKVNSGVIRMVRKQDYSLGCNEKSFFQVVKMAFNHRRKMLRVSLKSLMNNKTDKNHPYFTKRPEQLSYTDFVALVNILNED